MSMLFRKNVGLPSKKPGAARARVCLLILIAVLCASTTTSALFAQSPNKPSRFEQRLVSVPDNRVQVADTARFPFSAIVKIVATFPNGARSEGSGALIGPNKVLTAEHVIYNRRTDEHASVEIYPGYANNKTSCKQTVAVSYSHGAHEGCHNGANCDIAIINTKDTLGCNTGWFGFRAYNNYDLNQVFIAGYPADRDDGEIMYFVRTTASFRSGSSFHNALMYRDWTYAGMSGGPIFTSNYYIVGIHTEGSSDANYGIAICNEMYPELLRWWRE